MAGDRFQDNHRHLRIRSAAGPGRGAGGRRRPVPHDTVPARDRPCRGATRGRVPRERKTADVELECPQPGSPTWRATAAGPPFPGSVTDGCRVRTSVSVTRSMTQTLYRFGPD